MTRHHLPAALVAVLSLALLGAAGCSSDDSESDPEVNTATSGVGLPQPGGNPTSSNSVPANPSSDDFCAYVEQYDLRSSDDATLGEVYEDLVTAAPEDVAPELETMARYHYSLSDGRLSPQEQQASLDYVRALQEFGTWLATNCAGYDIDIAGPAVR